MLIEHLLGEGTRSVQLPVEVILSPLGSGVTPRGHGAAWCLRWALIASGVRAQNDPSATLSVGRVADVAATQSPRSRQRDGLADRW